jgi:hypothetical protein
MGPVNWLAVFLGANLAVAVGIVWYGPLFRGSRPLLEGPGARTRSYATAVIVMLIAATMIGHNFARIGPEVLTAKPWLYWMMSGGLGLTIVAPALYLGLARHGVGLRDRLVDCGYWIVAFLAIGTTFWALS